MMHCVWSTQLRRSTEETNFLSLPSVIPKPFSCWSNTEWWAGTEVALACDVPEPPSPASEARRRDLKKTDAQQFACQAPGYCLLWPRHHLRCLTFHPSAVLPFPPPPTMSDQWVDLSLRKPCKHPTWTSVNQGLLVYSGFFYQCRHFWRALNSTHLTLRS